MSDMNSLQAKVSQAKVSGRDESQDDLRAQVQEAQIKLKAAEEEIQRLQQQQQPPPQEGETKTGSRCLILERERSLCKTELRSTHAKVPRFL